MIATKTKRTRRTKAEMQALKDAIVELVFPEPGWSVRQIFYQLASVLQVIPKSQKGYDLTKRLTTQLRRSGDMPCDYIVDSGRFVDAPTMFDGVHDALATLLRCYRHDHWLDHDIHLEVWIEKAGLVSTLIPVTSKLDVGLAAMRGYTSISFLDTAAKRFMSIEKPCKVYYLGDHDSSGVDIDRALVDGLEEWITDGTEVEFERLAVLPEQIIEMALPTRPPKKNLSDKRAMKFKSPVVELDTIPPGTLRAIVRQAIEQHIDAKLWTKVDKSESKGKKALAKIIKANGKDAP